MSEVFGVSFALQMTGLDPVARLAGRHDYSSGARIEVHVREMQVEGESLIGQPAPQFELRDQHGEVWSPARLVGDVALLVFIPFPFTETCDGELCDIRERLSMLEQLKAKPIIITCDTRHAHRVWAEKEAITFPILSDFWPHGEAAWKYGCFDDQKGCARRWTFLIDKSSTIRDVVKVDSMPEMRAFADYRTAIERLFAESYD